MSKLLTEEQNYSHIANAIRARLASNSTFLPSEMGDAIASIDSIPSVPNGTLVSFSAESGNIPANSFIEMVRESLADGLYIGGGKKFLDSSVDTYICALDENRAVVFWCASSVYYAVVITRVKDDDIVVGEVNTLSVSGATTSFSAVALDSGRIALAHGPNARIAICTVSGTTVTDISDTVVSSTFAVQSRTDRGGSSIAALSSSTVVVVGKYSSTLYGVACSISGSTVTAGTSTQLCTINPSGNYASVQKLSGSSFFVSHTANNNSAGYKPYGVVCTVSGTSITPGTNTIINDTASTVSYSTLCSVALSSNTVFVQWGNSTDGALYGVICTISGTSITPGARNTLSSSFWCNTYSISTAGKIDSTHVLSIYAYTYSQYSRRVHGIICTISGSSITASDDTELCPINSAHEFITSIAMLGDDAAILPHYSNDSKHIAQVYHGPIRVRSAQEKVDGIVSQDVSATTPGNVWIWDNA